MDVFEEDLQRSWVGYKEHMGTLKKRMRRQRGQGDSQNTLPKTPTTKFSMKLWPAPQDFTLIYCSQRPPVGIESFSGKTGEKKFSILLREVATRTNAVTVKEKKTIMGMEEYTIHRTSATRSLQHKIMERPIYGLIVGNQPTSTHLIIWLATPTWN